jgi:DNA-binding response OmpR family regulator
MSTEQAQGSSRPKLSHELRTPLNHIIGYSEMLIEEADDAGDKGLAEPLAEIRRIGKQLLSLVNDVFSAEKARARETGLQELLNGLIPPANQVITQLDTLLASHANNTILVEDLVKIHAAANKLLELIAHSDDYTVAGITPGTTAAPTSIPASVPFKDLPSHEQAERGVLLVVDDNPQNREVLARHLERQGYYVVVAENGRRAIEMVGAAAFDLLLLDIMMPEMDGYEVLRYLKQDKTLSHIPVIMISALDEIESVVRCIEMGAEDYLPKPFDPVLLRARIGASLEKKRLRDQEIQYLEQVTILTNAASSVEQGNFELNNLDIVAQRPDALGNLARIFQHMAREVYTREQRLKQEVQDLRIEMDNAKRDRQVADITESDYFRTLQEKAHRMRSSSDDTPPEPAE